MYQRQVSLLYSSQKDLQEVNQLDCLQWLQVKTKNNLNLF
jgi:hypothetical protein